jgi:hypothetical protein
VIATVELGVLARELVPTHEGDWTAPTPGLARRKPGEGQLSVGAGGVFQCKPRDAQNLAIERRYARRSRRCSSLS